LIHRAEVKEEASVAHRWLQQRAEATKESSGDTQMVTTQGRGQGRVKWLHRWLLHREEVKEDSYTV
jgi:hypothetical protein